MRVRSLAVLVLLGLVATAQPAAAGGGGGHCAGVTRGAAVSMRDVCFQGTAHIVDPGSMVTVTNDGQMPHDFTAADGSFASGMLQPRQSFELVVDEAGVFPFFCTLHGDATGGGMAGVLIVGVSGSAADAPGLAASVRARSTAFGADDGIGASRAAAATNDVPSYLAAGALLMSSVALAVAIALVRPPRRERRAAGRA